MLFQSVQIQVGTNNYFGQYLKYVFLSNEKCIWILLLKYVPNYIQD